MGLGPDVFCDMLGGRSTSPRESGPAFAAPVVSSPRAPTGSSTVSEQLEKVPHCGCFAVWLESPPVLAYESGRHLREQGCGTVGAVHGGVDVTKGELCIYHIQKVFCRVEQRLSTGAWREVIDEGE